MLHTEEMRSQSTGTESPPNVRLPTPGLYVPRSGRMDPPHFCIELDELIRLVVAARYIPRHLTPSRCLLMGRHFVGNETAVRPSTGQAHRLLSER